MQNEVLRTAMDIQRACFIVHLVHLLLTRTDTQGVLQLGAELRNLPTLQNGAGAPVLEEPEMWRLLAKRECTRGLEKHILRLWTRLIWLG